MSLLDEYQAWKESIGTSDPEQGAKESDEWVDLHFDVEEFRQLFQQIQFDAFTVALVEGNLLGISDAIFYHTFRFATFLESQKYMPKLDN